MAIWADKYAADCMISGDQVADMILAVLDGDDCRSWDNNEYSTRNVMAHAGNQYCRTYDGTAMQVALEIVADYESDNVYGANHTELAMALIARSDDWR